MNLGYVRKSLLSTGHERQDWVRMVMGMEVLGQSYQCVR